MVARWNRQLLIVAMAIICFIVSFSAVCAGEPSVRFLYEIGSALEKQSILDWLKEGGWCQDLEVRTATEDQIRNLRKRGFRVTANLLANPETRVKQWKDTWKKPIPDVAKVIEAHQRAAGGRLEDVVWMMFTEEDSAGVALPQEVLRVKPKTHAQARALLQKRLWSGMSEATPYPNVTKWGMFGYASSAHDFAKAGLDCIINERANDDVDDLQTGIAFSRGAAAQFGKQWGIDLSVWWGPIYGCVHQLPSTYHRRHFYLSYFSGAQVLRLEGGDSLYIDGEGKKTVLGAELEKFGAFTRSYEPGKVEASVAVIVPADSGWISPPYWKARGEAWNYARIPARPGDRAMDGFFGAAFPGNVYAMDPFPFGAYGTNLVPASPFALSCVTPEFAPSPADVFAAEPAIPFGRYHDRDQARMDLNRLKVDPSFYRPMADSRWGDIFDVFTDEVDPVILSRYPVVIMLGPVRFNALIKKGLLQIVEGGCSLIGCSGTISPEYNGLIGLDMLPEQRVGRAWQWGKEKIVHEPYRFIPVSGANKSAGKVLAQTPDGMPLAVCKQLGSGRIYTCTIPWGESANSAISGVFLRLLDEVIRQVQPVHMDGLPVEWLSTITDSHRTVVVANHHDQPWIGTVHVRNLSAKMNRCTELTTNQRLFYRRQGKDALVKLNVPAFDVKVLRWSQP